MEMDVALVDDLRDIINALRAARDGLNLIAPHDITELAPNQIDIVGLLDNIVEHSKAIKRLANNLILTVTPRSDPRHWT